MRIINRHRVVVALLSLALFSTAFLLSSNQQARMAQASQNRNHFKQGAEIAQRVKDLRQYNKNVRAALGQFEKNGKRNHNNPKLDNAVWVSQDPARGAAAFDRMNTTPSPFRKVSLKPQEPDYSDYGVEMILIPTFYDDDEWQGTVILNGFDPSGNYLGQYVANVAMAVDSTETWDVYYEEAYYEGQGYLLYGNPGFELGTPRDNQDPGTLEPIIYTARGSSVRRAHATPPQAGFGGPPGGIFSKPKVRWVVKCTAIGSAGVAVRCGIVSLFFAGGPFVPCQAGGSAQVFTICTLVAIFGT